MESLQQQRGSPGMDADQNGSFPCLWCNKNMFSCLSLLGEISLKLLLNSFELRRQTLGNFKFEGHVAIGVGIGAWGLFPWVISNRFGNLILKSWLKPSLAAIFWSSKALTSLLLRCSTVNFCNPSERSKWNGKFFHRVQGAAASFSYSKTSSCVVA